MGDGTYSISYQVSPLVFQAHGLLYHSTLKEIKKEKKGACSLLRVEI
jgi:hypothetical protein